MDEQKELNKALNVGLFSLIGAIIPIIGLILAIVAASLASNVPSHKHTSGKKRTVYTVATIGIILAFLAGFGYYTLYSNQQKQERAEAQAQVEQAQRQQEEAQAQEASRQFNLNLCIQEAEQRYRESWDAEVKALGRTDDTLPQTNAERQDSFLKEWKDDCYKKHPVQ